MGTSGIPPLTIFQVVLIGTAIFTALMAAFAKNDRDNTQRTRLLASSLACWLVYVLLDMIGGLVK